MENIFTPEQANKPVTYGDLAIVLKTTVEELANESVRYADNSSEAMMKISKKLMDFAIKIRDDASYERQRDIRFVISLIAQLNNFDKAVLDSEYQRWCTEFDKLNHRDTGMEDKNE